MKKNTENDWEITNDGYEFLKEKKRRDLNKSNQV